MYFIHTQEEHREQGHATRLMGMIAQCMREHNTLRGYGPLMRMIFLHAPRESKGFYKRLEFKCADADFHMWSRKQYSLMQLNIGGKEEPQFGWFTMFRSWYDKEFSGKPALIHVRHEEEKND